MTKLVDEKEIALKLIKNFNGININTYQNLLCYTKYLKNETKKTKNEIRNELDSLMLNYYTGFVMADWDKTLQKIVNKYTKPDYRDYKGVQEVKIYKEELEFIKSIGDLGSVRDIEVEKVLFIMLVLGKINGRKDDNLWVNEKSLEIFKLARFKYKQKSDKQKIQREKLIYDLVNYKNEDVLDVVAFGKSTGMKLLFSKSEGEVVLTIDKDTDLENIIVQYLNWRNKEGYNYCIVCGKGIIIKSNNQIYCSKCLVEVKKEQTRIAVAKHRKRNVSI